ncbi:MAG: YCF48-related protein [Balneolaceae bacterium]
MALQRYIWFFVQAVFVFGALLSQAEAQETEGFYFWVEQQVGPADSNTFYDVHFTDSENGWITGAGGNVFYTSDGGETWSEQTSGTTVHLRSLYFPDSEAGWAAGNNGTILHTSDGGETWSEQTSGTTVHLQSLYFPDSENGWGVGNNRVVLKAKYVDSLEPPVLAGPEDEANVPRDSIQLFWEPEDYDDFLEYELQVSSEPDFSDTLYVANNLTSTTQNVTTQDFWELEATYYWRVRNYYKEDQELISSWSEGSFAVEIQKPELFASENEEIVKIPFTLEWEPEKKPNHYTFNIQMSGDENFSELVYENSLQTESELQIDEFSFNFLDENRPYYWRVQRQYSHSVDSLVSDWSETEFLIRPTTIYLRPDSVFTLEPNYVNIMLHAEANSEGVTFLEDDEFRLLENGSEISPTETKYQVDRLDRIDSELNTILVMDNSQSIGTDNLELIKEAASDFVSNKSSNQNIAIYIFGDQVEKKIDYTSNENELLTVIDEIELTDIPGTNLYGATIEGLRDMEDDQFGLDFISQNFMVLFTDGRDLSGEYTLDEVLEERGFKNIYAIGIEANEDDFDQEALEEIGNAGTIIDPDFENVISQFQQVSESLERRSNSFYWLNYRTTRSSSDTELRVEIKENEINSGIDYQFPLEADDFYGIPTNSIVINSDPDNVRGVDTLRIAADSIAAVKIFTEFQFEAEPFEFQIEPRSKEDNLFIEPNDSLDFVWDFHANGEVGESFKVVIQDTVYTEEYLEKELFIEFTEPSGELLEPEIAELVSPENEAEDITSVPQMIWNEAQHAFNYRLQVDDNSLFTSPVYDETVRDTSLTMEPGKLKDDTRYYWRVQSTNRGINANWSERWTFTTGISEPESVDLLYPLGPELEAGERVTFLWDEATSSVDEYRFQLTDNNDFENPVIDLIVTENTFSTDELTDGNEYQWRVQVINSIGAGPFVEAAEFTYQFVEGKPDLVVLESPSNGAKIFKEETDLQWQVPENATDYQLELAVDEEFSEVWTDTTISDTTYTESVLSTGYDYLWRVRAINEDDGITGDWSPPFHFTIEVLSVPEEIYANVAILFEGSSSTEDYRLLALPGQTEAALPDIVEGSGGVEWQAYWDNGSEENFLDRFDGSNTFTVEPGKGFWVTSSNDVQFSETLPMVEVNDANEAVIELHEGWNIISNPFDIDVPWHDVSSLNGGDLQPVWRFNGSFEESSDFISAVRGEAVYFLNDQELEELRIPYTRANAKQKPDSLAVIRLETIINKEKTSSAEMVITGADDQTNPDVIAPVVHFENASLRFNTEDQSNVDSRTDRLGKIYRDGYQSGHTQQMTLYAEHGSSVDINTELLEDVPYPEIRLINENTGESYDLADGTNITIRPQKDTTPITLIAGDAQHVQQQQENFLPKQVSVEENYPNPFNPETTLRFSLPEQNQVRLDIYNVIGQRVATLVNEERQAGVYTVRFDGARLASGLYFAVFDIGNQRFTQKMTLIK